MSVTKLQKTSLTFMDTKQGLSRHCLLVGHNTTDASTVTVFRAIILSCSGVSKSYLCEPNLDDIFFFLIGSKEGKYIH